MKEAKKHCGNCAFSYTQQTSHTAGYGRRELQHCSNETYNSPAYTAKMMLEDWGRGYCRFWTPKKDTHLPPCAAEQ